MSVEDEDEGVARRGIGPDTFRGVLVLAAAVAVGALLLAGAVVEEGSDTADAGGERTSEQSAGDDPSTAPAGGSTTTTTTEPSPTTTAPPSARQPAEVRVLVLNGSGRAGEAGRGTQFFVDAGYEVADPQNAPAPGPSAVLYVEGFEAEAEAAAAALGVDAAAVVRPLDPAAPPAPDLQGANLVVVAGSDGAIAF